MPSLRFTAPIRIKGLPEEAAEEWVDLEVSLAFLAPWVFGYLGPAPAREFEEESKTFTDNTFCDLQKISNALASECFCISIERLVEACRHCTTPKPHLLAWAEKENVFRYFIVSKDVVEYLP